MKSKAWISQPLTSIASLAAVLAHPDAAWASASDFPTISVRQICAGSGNPAGCEHDETESRRFLLTRWSHVSQHHKGVCLTSSMNVAPSYVALGLCLRTYLILNHRGDPVIEDPTTGFRPR